MLLFVVGSALRDVCGDQATLHLTFIRDARTAPIYRLYEIEGRYATLVEIGTGGISVRGEVCLVADEHAEDLLKDEPAGVMSMPVRLDDGTTAFGPVSTMQSLPKGATDISSYGGFAAFFRERERSAIGKHGENAGNR